MKYIAVCSFIAFLLGCAAQDKDAEYQPETASTDIEEALETPSAATEDQAQPQTDSAMPRVKMTTSKGVILIELDAEKAPISVENFLAYVNDGFYDGTIFHRVIPDFMIQGGGFTPDMGQKPTRAPIKNEAANGLKNLRGTVAMARTNVPDSATSQFFINLKDNAFLDYRGPQPQLIGYAVFGRVVSGMDVVDEIAAVPTGQAGPHGDVPLTPVMIESVQLVTP